MNVEAIVKAVKKVKANQYQVINAIRDGKQTIELWYDIPAPVRGNLIKVCDRPDFFGHADRLELIYRDANGTFTKLHRAWDELLPNWTTTGYNLPTEIVL